MKTILLFSGGLDSTTLLYKLLKDGHEVECLCFDYGQKHRRELLAAKAISGDLGASCHKVRLPEVWKNCNLVSGKPIHGGGPGDIVPNRNAIMLMIATAYAIENNAGIVAWGPNKDDWGIFPDCRPAFRNAISEVMGLCHTSSVSLSVPFIGLTKAEVVSLALELGVPTGETYSCYEGGREHCRKCGACVTRERAFYEANSKDHLPPRSGG